MKTEGKCLCFFFLPLSHQGGVHLKFFYPKRTSLTHTSVSVTSKHYRGPVGERYPRRNLKGPFLLSVYQRGILSKIDYLCCFIRFSWSQKDVEEVLIFKHVTHCPGGVKRITTKIIRKWVNFVFTYNVEDWHINNNIRQKLVTNPLPRFCCIWEVTESSVQ